jgi:hypothetical protein
MCAQRAPEQALVTALMALLCASNLKYAGLLLFHHFGDFLYVGEVHHVGEVLHVGDVHYGRDVHHVEV